MSGNITNIFTVDLEDWFLTEEYCNIFPYGKLKQYQDNLINNTRLILSLLKQTNNFATFFVLGKIAETLPDLINEILTQGHEIASHGYNHTLLSSLNSNKFRDDIEKSHSAIYTACRIEPKGYRAPNFIIFPWAFEVLKSFNYEYDSSVNHRGLSKNKRSDFEKILSNAEENRILEFCLNSLNISGLNIFCSGGGYFRLYPYFIFKLLFEKRTNDKYLRVFYIHPWEFNNSLYKKNLKRFINFKNFINISSSKKKMDKLLNEFRFISFGKYLEIKNN